MCFLTGNGLQCPIPFGALCIILAMRRPRFPPFPYGRKPSVLLRKPWTVICAFLNEALTIPFPRCWSGSVCPLLLRKKPSAACAPPWKSMWACPASRRSSWKKDRIKPPNLQNGAVFPFSVEGEAERASLFLLDCCLILGLIKLAVFLRIGRPEGLLFQFCHLLCQSGEYRGGGDTSLSPALA